MLSYSELVNRLVFKSETDEEKEALIDYIFNIDKKELFVFLKSMAVLLIEKQKQIKELEDKLSQLSGNSSDSST